MALTSFASTEELVAAVGRELGPTDWVEISQDDVGKFADASRAHQWIHVDPDRARRESPFGTTVVHGYLTLSLATYFLEELFEVDGFGLGVNYGLERVRFPDHVPVGSRLRVRGELLDARPHGDGIRTVVRLAYECEGRSQPPCVADVVSLILPGS